MGQHHYSDVDKRARRSYFKVALRRVAVYKVLRVAPPATPGPSRPTAQLAVVPAAVTVDGDELGRVDQAHEPA
jgi:hypothetical protein